MKYRFGKINLLIGIRDPREDSDTEIMKVTMTSLNFKLNSKQSLE